MIKMAKDMDKFKKWVLETFDKKMDKPETTESGTEKKELEPVCIVTMARDANMLNHNEVHDKIRKIVIDFCRENQIMDLQIIYRKNQ